MEKEDIVKFYAKMKSVRKEILAADWGKDKYLSFGAKGYYYLSVDKMKRIIAPILLNNGLDLSVTFHDLEQRQEIGSMTQHWTVKLDAALSDMDTGFCKTYYVYGESGDSGDKGVSKAQTAAMKQFLSNVFLLIDGIEPDEGDAGTVSSETFASPHKSSTEVRSAVLSNAVKSNTPTAPKVPGTPVVPKTPPIPKATPNKPLVAPTKPTEPIEKPSEVKEGGEEPKQDMEVKNTASDRFNSSELPVTKPQANSINNIVTVRTQWAQEGKMSKEEFDEMSSDFDGISDTQTAMAFIKKYRVRSND